MCGQGWDFFGYRFGSCRRTIVLQLVLWKGVCWIKRASWRHQHVKSGRICWHRKNVGDESYVENHYHNNNHNHNK